MSKFDREALLNSLNERQRAAVEQPGQSSLIIAGAGSGKTKVLTSRIAFLIGTKMAWPDNILAVTFTNKAAKEMLERLEKIGVPTKGMWVGTFHGVCNRILRRYHEFAGLPAGFQILDVDDSKQIIKRIYKANDWSEERVAIKDSYAYISGLKEEGRRPDRMSGIGEPKEQLKRKIFEAYEEQLAKEGAVDFADLMVKTVNLLESNEEVLAWAQKKFSHVLVDEFQDTNTLQYRWLKRITGTTNPVFAVGDDDQSIYAFRGAKVENMQQFMKEFQVQSVIRLEQNYRSEGVILKAANALIARNSGRMGKNLWTDKGDGRAIHLKETANEAEEATFIARSALALRDKGVDLSEIAVLYRTNSQSRAIEHAFFQQGIPYRVHGGLRFFERAEIKNALAYLRIAANPADDSAMLRVINFPPRGVGAKTLEKYSGHAIKNACSLWDSVVAGAPTETGKAGEGLRGFVECLEAIRADSSRMRLRDLIAKALEFSGLMDAYQNDKEDSDRVENLKELVNAASAFESEGSAETEEMRPLDAFLAHAALEAGSHGAEESQSAAQMMTVHAAKGLEFDHVFIGGLEEGIFPHANSMAERKMLEEERRLMYVAITRARRELTISLAKERSQWGTKEAHHKSRFLAEIPSELLESLDGGTGSGIWGTRPPMRSVFSGEAERERSKGKLSSIFATEKKESEGELKVGQRVRHEKFGEGKILAKQDSGGMLVYEVQFAAAGRRRLVGLYAKLTPI